MIFQDYSHKIVRDFLGSVAFIDDRIFTSDPVKPSMPPVKENIVAFSRVLPAKGIVDSPSVVVSKVESASSEQSLGVVIKKEDVDIDPKEFVSAFTKEGIHCSLCEYDNNEKTSYNKLLQKSDVAILDWNMNSGNEEGTEACELIGNLLNEDKELSLRLIVIYTSTPKPQWPDILEQKIKPLFAAHGEIIENHSFVSGLTKVVFIHKGDPSSLPSKIIDEFTKMTSGLVSNAALNAITTIRKNSHKLLGVYNSELDPGYLSHKMLLPNPEDSEEQIYDLIGSEIKSIIKSDDHIEELEVLPDYFDQRYNGHTSTFDLNKEDVFTKEFAETLPDTLNKDSLLNLTKLGIENMFIKNETSANDRLFFSKKCHLSATKYFTNDVELARQINKKFSMLSSLKTIYNTKDIYLQQGTILSEKKKSGEFFWLCVQPKCDSIRITNTREFIFVKLKMSLDNNFEIILESGKSFAIDYKIYNACQKKFKAENGKVKALFDDLGNYFKIHDGPQKLYWLGELKNDFAQYVSNQFGNQLARVGIDHYEWLRRS